MIRPSWRISPGTWARASRADSIGSRVKATKRLMRTATEMVMPNCRKNWPVMPFMKATGTKTATSVKVVAMTARAISRVPSLAARAGGSPCSSRRVMLSRTTTASSMSRPMASERPSRVSWFSENPSTYMKKSVPTTEVGSASAEMKVPRGSRRKTRMMRIAMAPPKKMAIHTSWALASMVSAWSMSTWDWNPNWRSSSGSTFFTALATAAELAPACFTTSMPTASAPLVRTSVRGSFIPLRTSATSPRRTWLPSGPVATTIRRSSSAVENSPFTRTPTSLEPEG